MLQKLSIQNLALIEKLDLTFYSGFTSLTGETGAGKSILLDALGLTLGDRADKSLVRHNTSKADVTAFYDLQTLPNVKAWLVEQELEDEDNCFIRRTVRSDGRSKAYINSYPVAANQLKRLGAMLIDIHGQHEHQSLTSTQKQCDLLDAYANHPSKLTQTREAFLDWQARTQQLQALQAEQADITSKLELLRFQQHEFAEINPTVGEYTEFSEEQKTLSHSSEIKSACEQAYSLLENDSGVSAQLNQAIHALTEIVEVAPSLHPLIEQLNSSLIEAQEAASEIQHHADQVDLNPQHLMNIEERLAELFGLAKKYHIEPEQLPEKQQQIADELSRLEQSDESVEMLKKDVNQAWKNYKHSAQQLTESRTKAAKKLAQVTSQGMHALGMPNGEFTVWLETSDHPSAKGLDKTTFAVTANTGQPLQALTKVASGGELSRISLAIQVATSEVVKLPTLIFDEVDVGIGGGIAEIVGEKMQRLGQHKQILSITHLPQVAAHGDQHLFIQKHSEKNLTRTQVTTLDKKQRTQELARMLGGVTVTEQTLKHAQEMLQHAQAKQE